MSVNWSDPSDAATEIRKSIARRALHTSVSEGRLKRLAGNKYRADWSGPRVYEAHEFEWISNFKPQLIYRNPGVACEARTPLAEPMAQMFSQAMTDWCKRTDVAEEFDRAADDLQMDFAVVQVVLEEHDGWTPTALDNEWDVGLRPRAYRVSPRQFFMDYVADRPDRARYAGHWSVMDRKELEDAVSADPQTGEEKPVYDRGVLDSIGKDAGVDEVRRLLNLPSVQEASRDEIVVYEVYDYDDGMIRTFAFSDGKPDGGSALEIRPAREFVGERTMGPYVLFGIYSVPDQLYPLAPLAVTDDETTEANAHMQKASEDAASRSRKIVFDASAKDVGEMFMSADRSIIGLPNFTGQYAVVEAGGVDSSTIEWVEYLKSRREQKSGLTDVQRGEISGDPTATEVAQAQAMLDIRVKYAQDRFRRSVVAVLKRVAWYMWHTPDVRMSVSSMTEGRVTGSMELRGGEEFPPDVLARVGPAGMLPPAGVTFDDLVIDIQPMSMEIITQTMLKSRALEMKEVMLQIAPQIVAAPHMNWKWILDTIGEAWNEKGLGDKAVNWEMVQAQVMLGVQERVMGMQQGEPGQEEAA